MKNYGKRRNSSTEMLEVMLDDPKASTALMKGDSRSDVKMAEKAGIDCCPVNP